MAVDAEHDLPEREPTAALFPLPLTPFERFLFVDDSPDYPKTFHVQLRFGGCLREGPFADALRHAAARHPLLTARVVHHHGRLEWHPGIATEPWYDFAPTGTPLTAPDQSRHDLAAGVGMRVWARAGEEQSTLLFQFHHVCCDGQGGRQVVNDWCTGYARAIAAHTDLPEWKTHPPSELLRRGAFAPPALAGKTNSIPIWRRILYAYRFLGQHPRPLAPVRTAERPDSSPGFPGILSHQFSRDETAAIQETARTQGLFLNDVALTLLFQTLVGWNERHGSSSPRDRIRLMIPMQLRESRDRRMPAANRMSFGFVTRTVQQCQDFTALQASIRGETQHMKSVRLGLDFLNGLGLLSTWPRIFDWVVRRPWCLATAVLTNVAEPARRFRRHFPVEDGYPVIGNLLLKEVTAAPPLRPRTRAGFSISECAGRLSLCLRADPRTLGESASRELLDEYVKSWRKWTR